MTEKKTLNNQKTYFWILPYHNNARVITVNKKNYLKSIQ